MLTRRLFCKKVFLQKNVQDGEYREINEFIWVYIKQLWSSLEKKLLKLITKGQAHLLFRNEFERHKKI